MAIISYEYSTRKNKRSPEQITQRDFIVIMILPLVRTQHIKYLLKINCFQITYLQYKEQYLKHVQQKENGYSSERTTLQASSEWHGYRITSLRYHTVKPTRMILATTENKAHIVQNQVIEARDRQPGEKGRKRKQRQKEEMLWCLHFGDQEMQTHIKK